MEVYSQDTEDLMKYYDSGADMPFNFGFIAVNSSCGGTCFRDIAKTWIDVMPSDKWPNFIVKRPNLTSSVHFSEVSHLIRAIHAVLQLGNHDQRRITTRKGEIFAQALNTMLLLLPGTPTTYQGEEIAQLDIEPLSFEETQDPAGKRLGEVKKIEQRQKQWTE